MLDQNSRMVLLVTPGHLLGINQSIGLSVPIQSSEDVEMFTVTPNSCDTLRTQLAKEQIEVEKFWRIWETEYIANLGNVPFNISKRSESQQ